MRSVGMCPFPLTNPQHSPRVRERFPEIALSFLLPTAELFLTPFAILLLEIYGVYGVSYMCKSGPKVW